MLHSQHNPHNSALVALSAWAHMTLARCCICNIHALIAHTALTHHQQSLIANAHMTHYQQLKIALPYGHTHINLRFKATD